MQAPVQLPVTVVMVTMNRRYETLNALSHLLSLNEMFPIIVIDNGSSDGTTEAIRSMHPDILVYEAGENLGSAGRTVGVKLASTPYIAFADDDSWWHPGSLVRAIELLEAHKELGVICGQILVNEENRPDPVCTLMAESLEPVDGLPGVPITGILACAAIVRRDTYLAVGGFDPRMGIGGEEGLFTIDVWESNQRVHYVDEVIAHHWPSTSTSSRSGRRRRAIRNDLWTIWLRRPLPVVLHETKKVLALAVRDADNRRGLFDALRQLPWVLRNRRRISPELEQMLQRSETFAISQSGDGPDL